TERRPRRLHGIDASLRDRAILIASPYCFMCRSRLYLIQTKRGAGGPRRRREMAETPASATQVRVARLFDLAHDGTYGHAARTLEAAGLPSDGCPAGLDWRAVKKLDDAALVAALPE